MFGMLRRARKKKAKKVARKLEADQKEKERLIEFNRIQDQDYLPKPEETERAQTAVDEMARREEERIKPIRETQKQQAMEEVNTPTQGLTPVQRQSMQETANRQIAGQLQSYQKMLSGSQGWRGVRGGKGQADVNRQALNAQTQVQRDLNLQDADLSMQRLAAYLSSLKGKESDEVLRNRQYWDYITGRENNRRLGEYAKFYNQYYGRV